MVLVDVKIGIAVAIVADRKLESAANDRLSRHMKLDLESC